MPERQRTGPKLTRASDVANLNVGRSSGPFSCLGGSACDYSVVNGTPTHDPAFYCCGGYERRALSARVDLPPPTVACVRRPDRQRESPPNQTGS